METPLQRFHYQKIKPSIFFNQVPYIKKTNNYPQYFTTKPNIGNFNDRKRSRKNQQISQPRFNNYFSLDRFHQQSVKKSHRLYLPQNIKPQIFNDYGYQTNIQLKIVVDNNKRQGKKFTSENRYNYKIEQPQIFCVICNKSYKYKQKQYHLQLHQKKILQIKPEYWNKKFNHSQSEPLLIKPIVSPIQYNVKIQVKNCIKKQARNNFCQVDKTTNNQAQVKNQSKKNEQKLIDEQQINFAQKRVNLKRKQYQIMKIIQNDKDEKVIVKNQINFNNIIQENTHQKTIPQKLQLKDQRQQKNQQQKLCQTPLVIKKKKIPKSTLNLWM